MSGIAKETTDWSAAIVRARRDRLAWTVGTHLVLALMTLPVVMLFLWLVIGAFTPITAGRAGADALLVAALILAVAGPLAVGAMVRTPGRTGTLQALAVVAVGVAVFAVVAPVPLTIDNFALLWDRGALMDARQTGYDPNLFPSVWQAAANSMLLAAGSAVAVVAVSTTAGYYLSRHAFPGRRHAFSVMLLLHAFPLVTLLVPIFLMMNWLGLTDSKLGVLLVITAIELPFGIFAMKGFFDAVPWAIEMSAMTDGASRTGAFVRILLPQVRGGMLAVGFFGFLRGWEEYIFVQSLIYSRDNWTMSQFVFFASDDFAGSIPTGIVFATGLVYLLPSVILYAIASREIDKVDFGGTKG